MRTYGRILNPDGSKTWQEVTTDPVTGSDDLVWIITLVQTLRLNLGESPFYANYGIPAKLSVLQQLQPDYYVNATQKQFAPYFASLIISKVRSFPPTYNVNVTTHQGVKLNTNVQIPT